MRKIIKQEDGLYLVSRTSEWGHSSPCEEAFQATTLDVDVRSVDDPKKIPAYKGKDDSWWYEEGANHRVENGNICRDIGWSAKWFVKIDSLIDFVNKYGDCVLSIGRDGFISIEIYDDYRE